MEYQSLLHKKLHEQFEFLKDFAMVAHIHDEMQLQVREDIAHDVGRLAVKAVKKAMVAHFAFDDTLQKSLDHARLVFRKASMNPEEMSYIMRGDLARETEQGLDVLSAWSDAACDDQALFLYPAARARLGQVPGG